MTVSLRSLTVSALLVAGLAAGSPAAAQILPSQIDELRAQQQAADRRAIDQSNQLQAMETRLRADQAAADLSVQRSGVRAPELRYDPPARSAATVSPRYPVMPDAALADSNRRVQDAARNRR